MACTPDVYRLCANLVPNEDAIVACLQQKKASLSPSCKAVFSRQPASGSPAPDSDD